ncbi:hypothetical protein NONI108955_44460 [Nocardia ninae]|uniref:Uncharacterized protein n=1 Tax=Nocardia ninae NBRC 108245 TaxID=1210091 RepID=A0A511MJU7_9NOCA|nr:hypothetical protein NN4_53880 [Nocardia ninae NBRC 108245]
MSAAERYLARQFEVFMVAQALGRLPSEPNRANIADMVNRVPRAVMLRAWDAARRRTNALHPR